MTTAKQKMDEMAAKLAERKDALTEIGAVYKFVIEGDDGGTWVLDLRDTFSLTQAESDAQCTLKIGAEDFVDMLEDRANPQQFFFTGRLRIEGDMGLAMKLQQVIDTLK